MTTLIHGDDATAISNHVAQILAQAKHNQATVIRLSAEGLTAPELELTLTAQELFESNRVIIIDAVHSLPVGKRRSGLIARLSEFRSQTTQLILVESKMLTPTQLKVFGQAKVLTCKLPKTVFAWLDGLGLSSDQTKQLTLLNQAIHDASPEQVFYLLIRHIRLLVIVADGGADQLSNQELPAFARSKMLAQARRIGLDQLVRLYQKLLEIDLGVKTGRSLLTLDQQLQQLVLEND